MHIQTIISTTFILSTIFGPFTPFGECANILAVVPFNGKSHFTVISPLLKGLAKKGHNVTVVSAFPLKNPSPNYVDVDLSGVLPATSGSFTLDYVRKSGSTTARVLNIIREIGDNLCEKVYEQDNIINLLNTTHKYDLFITEIFSTDCFLPFAHKFDTPAVSIVTSVALPWANDRIGNPDNPSYIPNYFLPYTFRMTFKERFLNTLTLIYSKIYYYYRADKPHYEVVKKYFGDDLPSIEQIALRRTSLVLVNSHYTVNSARPLEPNFIEIGGIHLQQPEPLPKDINDILDNATSGFVFFSMGSLIKGSSMDKQKMNAFIKAFSMLPEILVVWKFEEDLLDTPSNVIIRKWWPQKDILGHKNIRVFITHGGLSSTLETVNAGVPILGIPLFADQPGNINSVVEKGAGIQLDYDDITFENLYDALKKLTDDKSYLENAKKLSRQFRDRPLSPLDSATYWIEHVLKHKGAYHMRSAGTDLPLYQYLLLDVIAFMLIILYVILFAIYKIIKNLSIYLIQKSKRYLSDENKKYK